MESRRRNDAAYFMLLLTYALAVVSRPTLVSIVFLPVMVMHGFTIDKVLPNVLSGRIGVKDLGLFVLNTVPYLYFFTPLIFIPAAAFLLSILLSYAKSRILPQLSGTLGISLLYLPLVQVFGGANEIDIGAYLVWATYTLGEAIYVEYKLPFRRVIANQLRVSWLASLLLDVASVAVYPLFILPLIEPTIRFMMPGDKLKAASQVKELGKRGIKKTLLVFFLLVLTIIIRDVIS
ncbi:hypothetical protein [Sulfuracidifex tepidarius]|uniref:Uncharacterized protein n=1 Tax=Sulfuracidifex tepidarius TaxID=1294262 RepID=A0A510E212_9CREN|nr:hypothetical protein [Sulfuracidifex tepidarius]BBG23780.1 hypothetical protein IC006_1074 [Sulfuracidifex tepidarius]BBG26535.1 hypothetical protein IC007_1049 [Sulfuracidifex tepidarius]